MGKMKEMAAALQEMYEGMTLDELKRERDVEQKYADYFADDEAFEHEECFERLAILDFEIDMLTSIDIPV